MTRMFIVAQGMQSRLVHLTAPTKKGKQRIKRVARLFPKGAKPKRYPRVCCSALNETCAVCYRWPFSGIATESRDLSPVQRQGARLALRR